MIMLITGTLGGVILWEGLSAEYRRTLVPAECNKVFASLSSGPRHGGLRPQSGCLMMNSLGHGSVATGGEERCCVATCVLRTWIVLHPVNP